VVVFAIPILAFVLFTSSAMGVPPGPPTVDAYIVNTPVPVTGDVTGTITGEVTVTNEEADAVPVKIVEDGTGNGGGMIQMVGFSSQTIKGDEGRLTMDRLCRQDFPGSRMCSTAEALQTTNRIDFSPARGWIQPTLKNVFFDPNLKKYVAYDSVSGQDAEGDSLWSAQSSLDCQGWVGSSKAINVEISTEHLYFDDEACSASHPVACCR
jgi:hypothetical protein